MATAAVVICIFLTVGGFLGLLYLIWYLRKDQDTLDGPRPPIPIPTVAFSFNRPKLIDPYTYENELPTAWPRQTPDQHPGPERPVQPHVRPTAAQNPEASPSQLISLDSQTNSSGGNPFDLTDPHSSGTLLNPTTLPAASGASLVPAEVHRDSNLDNENLI